MYIPDNSNWFDRGALLQAARNADETEFAAMMEGGAVPLERGIRDDIVAEEHHADIPEHDYTWRDEEAAIDFIAGPLIAEIDRRSELLGGYYPFEVVNSSLRYKASASLVYEFCLAVSLQRNLSKKPFNKYPLRFEFIAAEAARCYLGDEASTYRTGWPPHNRTERPSKFNLLMEKLCSRTGGEFPWCPTSPLPKRWHVEAPKDEGMDFVAWKPFFDQRLGQLFILGQCACGDDWENKLDELQEARLRRWVNPVTHAQFIRAFAVPYHIPGHYIFSELNVRAGLTFDRIRIALLAGRNENVFVGKFRESIESVLYETLTPEKH